MGTAQCPLPFGTEALSRPGCRLIVAHSCIPFWMLPLAERSIIAQGVLGTWRKWLPGGGSDGQKRRSESLAGLGNTEITGGCSQGNMRRDEVWVAGA